MPNNEAQSRHRSDGDDHAARDELVKAALMLFIKEPGLPALLSIDLAGIETDAELLAAVLAGAIPGEPARSMVRGLALTTLRESGGTLRAALADLRVTARKNFEPGGEVAALLYSRGVHAILGHRIAHGLWRAGRTDVALALKALFGRAFSTDIHPGARFGDGIWLDHGLGFVVGETAIIEDEVSIWHDVTLGSTLKDMSDSRHPRVRKGATIGAGAIVLGGIEVGEGSVIAAGSVVLRDVAPGTTVAGSPAKPKPRSASSFSGFDQQTAGPT